MLDHPWICVTEGGSLIHVWDPICRSCNGFSSVSSSMFSRGDPGGCNTSTVSSISPGNPDVRSVKASDPPPSNLSIPPPTDTQPGTDPSHLSIWTWTISGVQVEIPGWFWFSSTLRYNSKLCWFLEFCHQAFGSAVPPAGAPDQSNPSNIRFEIWLSWSFW